MALHDSWHIRSRARQCAATDRPFEEGETIVTALFPDPETGGYLRRDFSVEAWQTRDDPAEPPFSCWRTTYTPPVAEPTPRPLEKEDPESLLRRRVDEDEETTENVRYILAVMLERKKILRETDTQTLPSGILRIYEHRKSGDAFLVRDPNIPLEEVERVQQEVILLLENHGKLPPENPPENPPEADAPSTTASPPADTAAPANPFPTPGEG
jgi:hypothetical protein